MMSFSHHNRVSLSEISTFVGLNAHSIYFWNREKQTCAPEVTFSLPAPDMFTDIDITQEQEGYSFTSQKESSLNQLLEAVSELQHTAQRSKGVGDIHDKFKKIFSRREIDQHIREARAEHNKQEKEECTRIKWRMPMTCIAFDDTWVYTKESGEKVYIHNIKDLSSQYILPPMAGKLLSGKDVAKNLENIFFEYGAPLFLKRDNGKNLDCKEVNELLNRFDVIPLNSPPYYSKYNGSVEQSNYWIKEQLKEVAEQTNCPINDDTILALARLAAHEENLKQRRVLNYSRAVEAFWLGGRERDHLKKTRRSDLRELVNERERKFLDDIQEKMDNRQKLSKSEKRKIKRKAVEDILRERGYIEVIEPKLKKCQPIN